MTRDQYGKLGSSGPCGDVVRFHSIFSLMTDEVFSLYEARGAKSRNNLIISAQERAGRPLQCEGEFFANEVRIDDSDEVFALMP